MQPKTATTLLAKASQAMASARVLLLLGDVDGACNRTYCAMFDAAQAALLMSGVPVPDALGKTHRCLINTFCAIWVKDGLVSKELGRQLKRAEGMCLVADCNGESVLLADAAELVTQAEVFVKAMQVLFFKGLAAPESSEAQSPQALNKPISPVDSQGTAAITKVPRKMASKAGSTATATSRTDLPNMADEK